MKPITFFAAILWCLGWSMVPALKSQTLIASHCDEFFITIDPTTATQSSLGRINNIGLTQNSQQVPGGTFFGVFAGFGTYGPIFENLGTRVEYFWFSASGGNVGGIQTLDVLGRFSPPNLGPGEYLGARFTTLAGGEFHVHAINGYGDLDGDMLYGIELNCFADILDFQPIGAAQGIPVGPGTAGNIFAFVDVPRISEIRFLDIPSVSPLTFSGGAFTVAAPVTEIVWRDGTRWFNAADDPFMADGVFWLSGTNLGTDLLGLSDFNASSTVLTVTSTAAGVWSTAFPLMGSGSTFFELAGANRHRPREVTDFPCDLVNPDAGVTLSAVTNAVAVQFREDPAAFMSVRIDLPGGPRLSALYFDDNQFSEGEARSGASVLSGGGLEFAAVNLGPNADVYNVFAINNTAPLGSGPLFGIPFGGAQINQMFLPQGFAPIHVMSDARGVYEWGVPAGSIPAGIVIDSVTFAISSIPGVPIKYSNPLRLNF